jgi:Rad3-related DNA helicase
LRTHHGEAGSNVHRACTCGYTEAIQAVFEKGEECDKREFVDQSIQDMIYFVKAHLERIDEYRAFAKNLTEYLQATAKSNPELKEYLEDLEATAQQIPAEYENQKENMKSLEYAAELEKKTMALTGKKDPENLKRYMELLKLWRAMGGAQDGVVAQYHILARKIFQDAGYGCVAVKNEKAVEVGKEVMARCKQILRNPDGYEIWANY